MNGELPLIAVAGGGSAMLAGIHLYERRAEEAMRASRVRLALTFPADVDPVCAEAALAGIAGTDYRQECVFSVEASEDGIRHLLFVPAAIRHSVVSTLTGAMPGLRATEAPVPTGRATLSAKLHFPTPIVLTAEQPEAAARTLLSGIATLASGEHAIVRVAVRPGRPRARSLPEPRDQATREAERIWRRKVASGVGSQAAGLVLVRAASVARAREICEHLTSSLRSRRGPVGTLRITTERGNRSLAAVPKTTRSSGWLTASETLGLLAWPLGDQPIPGVEVGATRELLVPRTVARHGIRLFVGRDAAGDRVVAHSPLAATHHTLVLGASGTGKSSLLAGVALSAIEHGIGGAILDPKQDLVEAILRRVRPADAERVVIVDPGDRTRPLAGVAAMAAGDADLRADVLTGAVRSAFPAEAWGVRTSYYLTLALRTLAAVPGATLIDVGRLFFEESYLRAAIARLSDPYIVAAWQGYLNLSAGARSEHVQAPMNRIMALLTRPRIRAIVAAREPKLDIGQLLDERKFLLVNLAPGVLGEAGAAVLGSVLMYVIWNAIEQRVALPPEQRHPVLLFLDEFATLAHGTPFGFELLAERARGLGAGLMVSLQTLGRVPQPIRGALLGNAASLIAFRSTDEPAAIAKQLPGLTEADIRALGRFQVAARLGAGLGGATTVVTGRTTALPPETGLVEAIRDASAARYGSEPEPATRPGDGDDERSLGRGRRPA